MANTESYKSLISFFLILLYAGTAPAGQSDIPGLFDPFGPNDINVPALMQDEVDQGPLVSDLQFVNEPISTVLRIISDTTGWSIFATPDASNAKVTFWATGITTRKFLEQLVAMAGFTHHQEGDIITIMTYDEYTQFYGLQKEVITLDYASAESISLVVKGFASNLGKHVVHKETNSIVLFDTEASLETITKVIEKLDTPVEPETVLDVIELRYMDAEILAEALQKVFGARDRTTAQQSIQKPRTLQGLKGGRITGPNTLAVDMLAPPTSQVETVAIGRTNQLIVKALRRDMEAIKTLVAKLDMYVEPTTKSYHFIFVDAAEIYNGLERILDIPMRSGMFRRGQGREGQIGGRPGGVTLVEKNNSILLTAPPSVHRVMTSIIETVDVPATYEAGVIKVYKIDNADIDEIATAVRELLQSRAEEQKRTGEPKFREERLPGEQPPPQTTQQTPQTPQGQTPQGLAPEDLTETERYIPQIQARVAVSKATNSIIVQATARQHRELEQLIKVLDKRRQQVLIEAMIIEVTTSDDMDLGVELNYAGNSVLAFSSFGLSSIDLTTGERDIVVSPGGTAGIMEPDDVQAILHALQSTGNIRITSAPQVLVNDNAVGTILSIAEEPTTQTNQGETTTTTSFAGFVEAGTQFKITPHISESDYLRVEYAITLNAFGEKADPVIPPARSTSQITSEATVPNGHTIIVGGLQSSNISESVDKVPLLGDIPILGLAFRNTISRKQYITTYLFITTTIMKSEDFADLKQISDYALTESSKSAAGSHVSNTEPNDVSPQENIAEDPDRNPDL